MAVRLIASSLSALERHVIAALRADKSLLISFMRGTCLLCINTRNPPDPFLHPAARVHDVKSQSPHKRDEGSRE